MTHVVNMAELPGDTSRQFEGYAYGDVDVAFFVSATPPGRGPSLHTHPYAEVFVVQVGTLTFTLGDATIEASAGQIVIVPPGVPHKFKNLSQEIAHHIDIHARGRMETTWLEA